LASSGFRIAAEMKLLRGCFVLAVPLAFLAHVFQIFDRPFWNAGLAYWLDPYFINALLEHWYVSLRHGNDPASPPMYFPVGKTLGYSHGLVLFAPFYIPLRLFLHPFLAYNWTVFLVLAAGIACLYVLFRKLGLTLLESLTIAALFFTSRNVINEPLSAWTQRASVFLIPPILLLLLVSARMTRPAFRIGLTGFGGFLSTLLYVQDFYTAHLAMLFVAAFAVAAVFTEGGIARAHKAIRGWWQTQTFASTAALVTAAGAAGWAWYLRNVGGGEVAVLGFEVRSHDVRRPAVIAVGAFVAFFYLNRRVLRMPRLRRPNSWWIALTIGGAAGAVVFLWFYLGAYLEHRAFPEEQLLRQLLVRDPTSWTGPLDMLRDLDPYNTWRSFILVLIVAVLVWIPQVGAGRKARIYWMWFLAVSVVVLFVPLRLGEFSVWRAFVEPLPGFGVIRDPKRIVYLYELAVALATAALLASFAPRSAFRTAVMLLALFFIATDRGPDKFRYHRSIAVFDRWVAAPIAIDPSCRSFYIKGASAEYMSRFDNMWAQYGLDSLFVAFRLGIPTLNGYSAWAPEGWTLFNPHEAGYDEAVQRWIDRHGLTNVCEFDIDARRMIRRAGSP
jgi:hypothetical protein